MPPYFAMHVFICLNQRPEGSALGCCFSKGAEKLFNYMKTKVKSLMDSLYWE